MNKVILVGNLVRDPELSKTNNGTAVCNFSIAVNRDYTNADGERDADFFNITVWRGRAETCGKYLKKGSKAAVTGSIQTRTYDAQDGSKRYVTEIVAEEVEFVGSKQGNGTEEREEVSKLEPVGDDGDDLPF